MSDDITPALDESEWRDANDMVDLDGECYAGLRTRGRLQILTPSAEDYDNLFAKSRHALAALCLYGQPFGFDNLDAIGNPTRGFVEALRDTADVIDEACGTKMTGIVHVRGPAGEHMLASWYAGIFRELADRIGALLPTLPQSAVPQQDTPSDA